MRVAGVGGIAPRSELGQGRSAGEVIVEGRRGPMACPERRRGGSAWPKRA